MIWTNCHEITFVNNSIHCFINQGSFINNSIARVLSSKIVLGSSSSAPFFTCFSASASGILLYETFFSYFLFGNFLQRCADIAILIISPFFSNLSQDLQILNTINTAFLLVFPFVFSLIQQGQINLIQLYC